MEFCTLRLSLSCAEVSNRHTELIFGLGSFFSARGYPSCLSSYNCRRARLYLLNMCILPFRIYKRIWLSDAALTILLGWYQRGNFMADTEYGNRTFYMDGSEEAIKSA
jgi:hypothetical protein